MGAFALAHPGSVALTLLFGALGIAVSTNALWMQSERHPAPLFHQSALEPRHSVAATPRKIPEPQAVAPTSAPVVDEAAPVGGPPSRPAAPRRIFEAGSTTSAKQATAKHSAKDPIADLLGEAPPTPPTLLKSSLGKAQTADKTARPPASSNDAIAGLIEQNARNR
jgi:hypothetical protein